MDPGKPDFFNESPGFGILGFRFSRESCQDIRGQGGVGECITQALHGGEVFGCPVPSAHPGQDGIAAALKGQMELGADLRHLPEYIAELLRGDHGFQGSQTDSPDAFDFMDHPDGVRKAGLSPFPFLSVGGQVNPRQHDLRKAGIPQAKNFGPQVLQTPRTDRASYGRDNAVCAVIIAAFLELDRRPGMLGNPRDPQRLKAGFRSQRCHRAERLSLFTQLLNQINDPVPVLRSQNQIRSGFFPQGGSLLLGQAAAENQQAFRVLPFDFPRQLQGFLVSGAGDGAGVDQINLRILLEWDGFVSRRFQQLPHGFRIVLVDLASEGVISDSHLAAYSISPRRASITAAATGPAVSVRRIRGPRVMGSKTPVREAISSGSMPPSGPIRIPRL